MVCKIQKSSQMTETANQGNENYLRERVERSNQAVVLNRHRLDSNVIQKYLQKSSKTMEIDDQGNENYFRDGVASTKKFPK